MVIKDDLALQLKNPVLWQQTVELMRDYGVDLFYELGPGRVLAGLNKRIIPDVRTFNVDSIERLKQLSKSGITA